MKKLSTIAFILLISLSACKKESQSIKDAPVNNSPPAYTWGALVQLQGNYSIDYGCSCNTNFTSGGFTPYASGNIGWFREQDPYLDIFPNAGTYKFDKFRFTFNVPLSTAFKGEWLVESYYPDYTQIILAREDGSNKIILRK